MLKGDFRFFKAFHELEQLWEADLRLEASRQGEREAEHLKAMIKSIFGIGEESEDDPLPDEDESDK